MSDISNVVNVLSNDTFNYKINCNTSENVVIKDVTSKEHKNSPFQLNLFSKYVYKANALFSTNREYETSAQTQSTSPSKSEVFIDTENDTDQSKNKIKEETEIETIVLELSNLIKASEFLDGTENIAESYFLNLLETRNEMATKAILRMNYINTMSLNKKIINGMLRIFARCDYNDVKYFAPVISVACTRIDDFEIKENALRTFSYWNNPEAVEYLKNITFESNWLKQYQNKIIKRFE